MIPPANSRDRRVRGETAASLPEHRAPIPAARVKILGWVQPRNPFVELRRMVFPRIATKRKPSELSVEGEQWSTMPESERCWLWAE
jgi:hypothetical protein